jgi:serine/threonine-protein phosphatase PP1 catalytic subunit
VVVVGDLHGQFSDLQRIFERLGRPGSDKKVWVFLGDYIDRGERRWRWAGDAWAATSGRG